MFECVLKGISVALWRRWFGGLTHNVADDLGVSHSNLFVKILDSRGVQCFIGIILFFFLFLTGSEFNIFTEFNIDLPIWATHLIALYNAVMLYIYFWSKGHGPMLDVGGDKNVGQATIDRYNSMWFTKYLDKFFNYYCPRAKYGVFYDWCSMTIRYTYPTLLIAPFSNFLILLFGPIAGFIYATFAYIQYNDSWVYKNLPSWLNSSNKVSEVWLGFIVGCII